MDQSANNKRIAKNTGFLYIRMFFVLIVSLYTSRVVLNTLGVSDYGVYNVVGGFVSLFGFLNVTLASSLQRFYNFEKGTEGEDGVRSIYTVGLVIHALLAVIVAILLETFGLWYLNNVMVVPPDRLHAANVLFQAVVISMLLVIIQIPYVGIIMANEKMDFYALVNILDVCLKLGIVIALQYLPGDKLIVYAYLMMAIQVMDFLLNFGYAKSKFAYLKLDRAIDGGKVKSILSFSGWNLLGTFAFMLKGEGLNLLLNGFFGTVVNAARGVAFQISGAINGFSSNIATAFRPQLTESYARGDAKRTEALMFSESKICFALLLVLMTPIVVEVNYILHIWLGNAVPESSNVFASLALMDCLICTLNTPCTQVALAVGKLKKYQIVTSVVNLMLLPVSWVVLKLGAAPVAVFVTTIVFSIINQTVCLYLLKDLFPYNVSDYLKRIILPCLVLLVIVPVLPAVAHLLMNESVWRLIVVCLAAFLPGAFFSMFLLFQKSERALVIDKCISRFRR